MTRADERITINSTDAVGMAKYLVGDAAEGAGAVKPMTFRERMRQRTTAVQQYVEADEWRVIKAKRGKCATCRVRFAVEELIVWRVGTREALHPTCFATTHPLLNTAFRMATATSHQPVDADPRER